MLVGGGVGEKLKNTCKREVSVISFFIRIQTSSWGDGGEVFESTRITSQLTTSSAPEKKSKLEHITNEENSLYPPYPLPSLCMCTQFFFGVWGTQGRKKKEGLGPQLAGNPHRKCPLSLLATVNCFHFQDDRLRTPGEPSVQERVPHKGSWASAIISFFNSCYVLTLHFARSI